jgi:argininosuccinate lyase
MADYLVKKGIPFRKAHNITGKIVAHCIEKKIDFQKLSLEDLRKFSPLFDSDVKDIFKWEKAIEHRNVSGGTGLKSVKTQIALARKLMNK